MRTMTNRSTNSPVSWGQRLSAVADAAGQNYQLKVVPDDLVFFFPPQEMQKYNFLLKSWCF